MKIKHEQVDAAELRRQAEAKLSERKKKATALAVTESDTQRLLHELEVHQIELEMQNEELVQSREQVEAGLLQYTDLYDFAPIGYFTLAHDGAIHQVNLAGASLLGVERGALINRRFGVFVSAKSRSVFNAFLEIVFGSQQKENCEIALQRDGSALLWVHIEAIQVDGQQEACRAVVSDITERKRVEEALRESESQFRELWGATVEGITILDKEIIIEVNDAMCQMFGYKRELVIGKSLLEFTPIEMHDLIRERITSGIEGRFETPALRADGARIILEAYAKQFDYQGKSLRLVTTRNITERKHVEEVLQEATKEREKLIRELQYALDNIKTLQGLIPMCANCKKIRDDKGFWNQVEGYLMAHTDAQFTHGICPECSKLLYGDLYEKALEKQNKKNM
jgi:PAS domain S-box-containing protein